MSSKIPSSHSPPVSPVSPVDSDEDYVVDWSAASDMARRRAPAPLTTYGSGVRESTFELRRRDSTGSLIDSDEDYVPESEAALGRGRPAGAAAEPPSPNPSSDGEAVPMDTNED